MNNKIKLGKKNGDDDEFQSLHKMNNYIKELVENNVFFMFTELLKKISCDYGDRGLTFDELKEKYLSYFKNNMKNSNLYCEFLSLNLSTLDLQNIKKTLPSKEVEPVPSKIEPSNEVNESKCRARTSSGAQCSRKRQNESDYCGSHALKQPYGRIDHPQTTDIQPKKRGRPPVNTGANATMQMVIESINEISYLVDKQTGNIYAAEDPTKDLEELENVTLDQLTLVGHRTDEGVTKWYSANDLRFM